MGATVLTETSRKIFERPGYTTDIRLDPDELEFFRSAISHQWLARIREVHPELVEQFKAAGLSNYHRLSHLVDHQKLWPKQHRVLPREVGARAKTLPVFSRLRRAFGDFSVSDVVYGNTIEQGREEFYWRLVRPSAESDVGPLHADKWFHETLGSADYGMFPPGTTTIKIWTAIYCEPGKSGLIVVPDSHLKKWRYRKTDRGGFIKPELDEDPSTIPGVLVPTEPGTLLIFNEGTLHGGAVNMGDASRVSMEITMVFR